MNETNNYWGQEGDNMVYSPLVDYVKISPNRTPYRNAAIDTITLHCVVGHSTVESLGAWFSSPACSGSSNYGIDDAGRYGCYVPEDQRSWCTSSKANDNRAVTIEIASDTYHPYKITDAAFEAIIPLVADICQRNKIKRLLWEADPRLIGQVKKQNMTVHRWFNNRPCPGDYIYDRYGEIARRVNEIIDPKEDIMTGEEIYKALCDYMSKMPSSDYAKECNKKAIESGIFKDGDDDGELDMPGMFLTREQYVTTLDRMGVLDKAINENNSKA